MRKVFLLGTLALTGVFCSVSGEEDAGIELRQLRAEMKLLQNQVNRQKVEIAKLKTENADLKEELSKRPPTKNSANETHEGAVNTESKADWPKAWEKSFEIAYKGHERRIQTLQNQIDEGKVEASQKNQHISKAVKADMRELATRQKDTGSATNPVLPDLGYTITSSKSGYVGTVGVFGNSDQEGDAKFKVMEIVGPAEVRVHPSRDNASRRYLLRCDYPLTLRSKNKRQLPRAKNRTHSIRGYWLFSGRLKKGSTSESVYDFVDKTEWKAAYAKWVAGK